ncbi:hypothetical protein [Streptomyces sp. NPDC101132]|uniref:hypothetical protein n=1 Tax=Streptomyces sp. NPDC101132 TaxID=3366110 RepID=UPI003824D1E1
MRQALPPLGELWDTVATLAAEQGEDPGEVLGAARLSALTGIPAGRVEAVRDGRDTGLPLDRQVRERFTELRHSRRRPDGARHSLDAIARHFAARGASLGALNGGSGLPGLRHAEGIQSFFGVYAGFLVADDRSAVEHALAASGIVPPCTPAEIGRIGHLTGIAPAGVARALAGEGGGLPLPRRVRTRFRLLRATRPGPDGEPYSLREIAASFSATAQSLSKLNVDEDDSLPSLAVAAGIQRFFGVDGGFLLADAPTALRRALNHVAAGLRRTAARAAEDPLEKLKRDYELLHIAMRASNLSPRGRRDLAAHLKNLLASEGITDE